MSAGAELVVAAGDALKTTEAATSVITEATTAAANIEQGAAAASNQTLRDLAEGPAQGEMDAMAKRDGLLTEDQYTDPKRQEIHNTDNWPDSSPVKIEVPARKSDEKLKKMDKGPMSEAEFD